MENTQIMTDWTSLEIAKLAINAALPLVLALLGFRIQTELKRREDIEWRTRIQVEWRLRVFEEMANELNKLYCAFNYVGDWRNITPPDIINIKRRLDRAYYIYGFMWSTEFRKKYNNLIGACFIVNNGPNDSAVICANIARYKIAWGAGWVDSWEELFILETDRLKRDKFNYLYNQLFEILTKDIGLSK